MAGLNLLRKDYAAAAKDFDKILGMDSVTIEAKIHIGELYFDQAGKDSTLIPRTKNIFEKIKTEAPNDWRPYWFLGAIGSLTKDDSASVQNFRKVTRTGELECGWMGLSFVGVLQQQ